MSMQPSLRGLYIDRGFVFRGQNSQTVSIGFINWQIFTPCNMHSKRKANLEESESERKR